MKSLKFKSKGISDLIRFYSHQLQTILQTIDMGLHYSYDYEDSVQKSILQMNNIFSEYNLFVELESQEIYNIEFEYDSLKDILDFDLFNKTFSSQDVFIKDYTFPTKIKINIYFRYIIFYIIKLCTIVNSVSEIKSVPEIECIPMNCNIIFKVRIYKNKEDIILNSLCDIYIEIIKFITEEIKYYSKSNFYMEYSEIVLSSKPCLLYELKNKNFVIIDKEFDANSLIYIFCKNHMMHVISLSNISDVRTCKNRIHADFICYLNGINSALIKCNDDITCSINLLYEIRQNISNPNVYCFDSSKLNISTLTSVFSDFVKP